MDRTTWEGAQAAVAVMTAAVSEEKDQKDLAAQLANEYASAPGGYTKLLAGFIQVGVLLLSDVEKHTGTSRLDQLRRLGEAITLGLDSGWIEEN